MKPPNRQANIPGELNPNHPVTAGVRGQWHKFCALLLYKSGATQSRITAADIDGLMSSDRHNIVVQEKDNAITLTLVSDAEAARLAKHAGGLPV